MWEKDVYVHAVCQFMPFCQVQFMPFYQGGTNGSLELFPKVHRLHYLREDQSSVAVLTVRNGLILE